jgi:hypothetical protein
VKALVDLCHFHGIAVVFDVVHNHAGGFLVAGQFDDIPRSAAPIVASAASGGAGFDVVQHDARRQRCRIHGGDRRGALPARIRPWLARGHLHREWGGDPAMAGQFQCTQDLIRLWSGWAAWITI